MDEAAIEEEVQVRVRVGRRRPRINVCPRAVGGSLPSLHIPIPPSFRPPRPSVRASIRRNEEKMCVFHLEWISTDRRTRRTRAVA